jgi:hypothetical protein
MTAYRQALRDVSQKNSDPAAIDWPTKPPDEACSAFRRNAFRVANIGAISDAASFLRLLPSDQGRDQSTPLGIPSLARDHKKRSNCDGNFR